MSQGKALLLAGVALFAFGSAADAATEVRVIVSHYSDQTGPIFEAMAEEFEAANPDIDIVIEDVAWGALQQRLTTDIAGGTAPDISIIGTRWLVDFVDNDIVEPLSGYMDDEFRSRFIDTFMGPSTIDGEIYGLPVAASARAMYYNKGLFEQAGVAAPPADWDELKAAEVGQRHVILFSDAADSPAGNCSGMTPMPMRFDRWMRSKLCAITAFTPSRLVPFAAQSRLDPEPYSVPARMTSGMPCSW